MAKMIGTYVFKIKLMIKKLLLFSISIIIFEVMECVLKTELENFLNTLIAGFN